MVSESIIDIWRFIGMLTPFVVKRHTWGHLSYQVTRVVPKGKYGEAYGLKMQDGVLESNAREEPIECCGCGGWELIEILNNNLEEAKWKVFDEDNKLLFGKYKGQNVIEVYKQDQQRP